MYFTFFYYISLRIYLSSYFKRRIIKYIYFLNHKDNKSKKAPQQTNL